MIVLLSLTHCKVISNLFNPSTVTSFAIASGAGDVNPFLPLLRSRLRLWVVMSAPIAALIGSSSKILSWNGFVDMYLTFVSFSYHVPEYGCNCTAAAAGFLFFLFFFLLVVFCF